MFGIIPLQKCYWATPSGSSHTQSFIFSTVGFGRIEILQEIEIRLAVIPTCLNGRHA
jgi:hypothetical protein